jgi:hypothetical protein
VRVQPDFLTGSRMLTKFLDGVCCHSTLGEDLVGEDCLHATHVVRSHHHLHAQGLSAKQQKYFLPQIVPINTYRYGSSKNWRHSKFRKGRKKFLIYSKNYNTRFLFF